MAGQYPVRDNITYYTKDINVSDTYAFKVRVIVFLESPKRRKMNTKDNRCGSHSLNTICSRTTEIERWLRENDTSGKAMPNFRYIYTAT
jgi:hypothetical protein